MSFTKEKTFFEKLLKIRSRRSFAFNFLLGNTAGQKLLLYNKYIPRVINISFNERTCMFQCKICPYSEKHVREMYKNKSEMSFDTLKNIVNSIPNDPFYSFDISSIGETLEYKALSDSIRYMKEQKPLVNTIISTNGVLLNEEISKQLIKSGLDSIQISLFAGNEEDHSFITGSKTFKKVKENIIRFKKLKEESKSLKPFVQTFMIETKETVDKSDKFVVEWSKYVDKAFVRPMYNIGEEIKGMTPAYEEVIPERRYPCSMPWYSTAIRSNGDVLGCYAFHWHNETKDSMVIGNINNLTLKEMWQSEKHQELRNAHLNNQLKNYPVCQRCNLWSAYTNIWTRHESGTYSYKGVSVQDFFIKSPAHRGG